MSKEPVWSVTREWAGQTAFIIAGGPSVSNENIDTLKGHRVVVINSSYEIAPWANFLIFGDNPWWNLHLDRVRQIFRGRVVTSSDTARGLPDRPLLHLKKRTPPPGLSMNPTEVVMQKTTLQAAINLVVHLGSTTIVLVGADMQKAADGRTHHHSPHPRPQSKNGWTEQMVQLRMVKAPLETLKIRVYNASPRSLINWWTKISLTDAIAGRFD